MSRGGARLDGLARVHEGLGVLGQQVVLVGGASAGLLVTSAGAPPAPATDDIDLVALVASFAEYRSGFRPRLERAGFRALAAGGDRFEFAGLTVDVKPCVLGSAGPRETHAIVSASEIALAHSGAKLRVIGAPAFVWAKLVSFRSRGRNRLRHHDVSELLAIVDGRRELEGELALEAEIARRAVTEGIRSLLRAGLAAELARHLPGDAASQARAALLYTRLVALAGGRGAPSGSGPGRRKLARAPGPDRRRLPHGRRAPGAERARLLD